MHKGTLISRVVAWIIFALFILNHRCTGQHYFFEEIKQLQSNFDPEQNETGTGFSEEEEPVITFENATFLQDDDLEKFSPEKINFPEFYHAQGIISLPYDGIIEPFEAWYGGRHKMSRIDYYYGKAQFFSFHIGREQVAYCLAVDRDFICTYVWTFMRTSSQLSPVAVFPHQSESHIDCLELQCRSKVSDALIKTKNSFLYYSPCLSMASHCLLWIS